MTSKLAKEYASQAKLCETSIEAKELLALGTEELQKIFDGAVRHCHLFVTVYLQATIDLFTS